MSLLRYLFLTALVLNQVSCGKDKADRSVCVPCSNFSEGQVNVDSTGVLYPHGTTSIGHWNNYNVLYRDSEEHTPVFNPKNADQVAYIISKRSEPRISQIVIKDIKANSAKVILQYSIYESCLDWGENGWLLFTGYDSQIYKIKSNGDSLTKLTSTAGNFHATWNNLNNTIFFTSTRGGGYPYFYFMNADGTNIVGFDSSVTGIFPTMSPDGKKVVYASGTATYSVFNLQTKQVIQIQIGDGEKGAAGPVQWFPDSKHLIATESGIQRLMLLDAENATVNFYYTGGHSKGYYNMAVSPDCKTIALERVDKVRLSDKEVTEETYISLMDINGKNERRLN